LIPTKEIKRPEMKNVRTDLDDGFIQKKNPWGKDRILVNLDNNEKSGNSRKKK
jgi:hypothetical protein